MKNTNNLKWFSNPETLEELKKQYKKLAIKHHPDMGGTQSDMQEINAEYDSLFNRLKNTHKSAAGETYTSKTETTETPDEFKDIINSLIALEGITIEICGSWLWITGDTYPHRKVLKELHFRFSKNKSAWYYHTADYRKTSNKQFTLNQIRDLYGSETISKEPQIKLQIV